MLTAFWRHAPRTSVFVLLVSLIPMSSLWACSCGGKGPPCQMAWTADAVFTGTVVEIAEPRVPTINNGSTTGRRIAADPAVSMPSRKRTVRIQVADVLTGVEPLQKEIEILTGLGGGDCGYLPTNPVRTSLEWPCVGSSQTTMGGIERPHGHLIVSAQISQSHSLSSQRELS